MDASQAMRRRNWQCDACGDVVHSDVPIRMPAPCRKCGDICFEAISDGWERGEQKGVRPGLPEDFVPTWPYSPDAPYWNEGTPWDDMQLHDLIWELNRGDTVEEIGVSSQRPPSDIRAKMRELG